MTLSYGLFFAARHPAGIDMCPSAGAPGTGHVIHDDMVSVLQRPALLCREPCSPLVCLFFSESTGHMHFVVF